MLTDEVRQILVSILKEEMSPRARAELERILGRATDSAVDSAGPATPAVTQANQPSPGPEPTLEDVRRSFMRMAPLAFEFSELNEPGAFWEEVRLSKSQLIEFWGKVWDSFDFNQSQYIDVELPCEEHPLDIQILFAALGTWTKPGGKDYLKDRVLNAGQSLEEDPWLAGVEVASGARRLENMLKYKHGLEPRGPWATPSAAVSVPFPWLDVQLSYFEHLGWKLLERDHDGEVIDYNDSYDPEDPYRKNYRNLSDHFTRWASGGLLMPLSMDHSTLAHAVRSFYSWDHPLCMVASAWRFALEMCGPSPTTTDLRAAMVYQITFAVQRSGALCQPWAWLSDDDDFIWPYDNLRAKTGSL